MRPSSFIADSIYAELPLHFGAQAPGYFVGGGLELVGFQYPSGRHLAEFDFRKPGRESAQVKTQTQAAIYSGGNWIGDLTDMNGIADGVMYKVNTTQTCILQPGWRHRSL